MDLRVLVQADITQKNTQNALWLGGCWHDMFCSFEIILRKRPKQLQPRKKFKGSIYIKSKRPVPIRAARCDVSIHWKEATKNKALNLFVSDPFGDQFTFTPILQTPKFPQFTKNTCL